MSEKKLINTETRVTILGTNISIHTWWDNGVSCILWILLAITAGVLNGINYLEGELVVIYNSCIDIFLNSDGEAIISGTNVNNYSINSDGELIYTD